MGKNLKCNLTPEEAENAFKEFDNFLTPVEELEIIRRSPNYIFFQVEKRGKVRNLLSSNPDCIGWTRVERSPETEQLFRKHGDLIPYPGSDAKQQLVCLGRCRTFARLNRAPRIRVTICRAGESGALLLMSGYASRYYTEDDLRPGVYVQWKAYTWLKTGKRMQWQTETIGFAGCLSRIGWVPKPSVGEPFAIAPYSYGMGSYSDGDSWIIGDSCIADTDLRYCQLDEYLASRPMGWAVTEADMVRGAVKYLSAYTEYPALEMAVRCGMQEAAWELVQNGKRNFRVLNWEASRLPDFLRMDKPDTKAFMSLEEDSRSVELLEAYRRVLRAGQEKNLDSYIEDLSMAGLMDRPDVLAVAAGASGETMHKAALYIAKNSHLHHAATFWLDYLLMAKELGYDLSRRDVRMPRNLRERHDLADETINAAKKLQMEQENRDKEINTIRRIQKLKKRYGFEYGGLRIIVPETAEEIIREGQTLHHCVGGYAGRHLDGKTIILFLRRARKPGTSYITLEMDPGKIGAIRQIHGYQNELYGMGNRKRRNIEKEFSWFLEIYTAWLKAGSKRDKSGAPILPQKEKAV